jgi:DNA-binding helix-hairpin-helix protein with protein kinase domain
MTLYLPDGRVVTVIEPEIGRGAEGIVFRLRESEDLCAKIVKAGGDELRERITALIRTAPASWGGDHHEHVHVAWPAALVNDDDGNARGYVMPYRDAAPLTTLFDPVARLEYLSEPTWRVMVTVAARTARLMARLHAAHIVIGDVSPRNVLLSRTGHVTLIDCDTVQFVDPHTGVRFEHTKVTQVAALVAVVVIVILLLTQVQ